MLKLTEQKKMRTENLKINPKNKVEAHKRTQKNTEEFFSVTSFYLLFSVYSLFNV